MSPMSAGRDPEGSLGPSGNMPSFYQGAQSAISQAWRQLAAADGVPVRWVVAEPELADWLRRQFAEQGIPIEVSYVPPVG